MRDYILGTRHYLLKENPETLPAARANLKRLYYLDKLTTLIFYGLVFYFMWSYIDVITDSFQYVFESVRDVVIRAPITRNLNAK